jgi:hypothetical protein
MFRARVACRQSLLPRTKLLLILTLGSLAACESTAPVDTTQRVNPEAKFVDVLFIGQPQHPDAGGVGQESDPGIVAS